MVHNICIIQVQANVPWSVYYLKTQNYTGLDKMHGTWEDAPGKILYLE